MGAIYVEVDASVANGIMTMDASGGSQENGYWLYWEADGFTGQNWYWGESNNYISIGWKNYVNSDKLTCGVRHDATEQGLIEHISGGHADDLNDVLGPWPIGDKMQFVGRHYNEFFNAGCVTEL